MTVLQPIAVRDLEPGDRVRWRKQWWTVTKHWPLDPDMADVPFGYRRVQLERKGRTRSRDLPGERRVRAECSYR